MVLDLDFFLTVQHADDAAGPRQDPKESVTFKGPTSCPFQHPGFLGSIRALLIIPQTVYISRKKHN